MKRDTEQLMTRKTKFGPALIVAFAVGVIGCGGGGGGGSTSGSPVVTGGSSSGGGTAGATTGEITTGGTSGSSVTTGSTGNATAGSTDGSTTTGSATTGSATTGSTDGSATTGSATTGSATTGSATTGSATTGSTDGSTTTGSATTGSATTGSTDGSTTTGSATTGSATTGSATTGSTDGSTTTGSATTGSATTGSTGGGGTPPSGQLRSNAIYFGHWTDGGIITSILPDGSGRQDVNDSGTGAIAATPDPDNAGKMIYASYVDTAYGIYRGASFDTSASIALTSASYDYISTLHPTANGDVMMVAGEGGSSYAYLLTGGSVIRIDEADGGAVSLDGTKIAYTKMNANGYDDLYLWDRGTSTSRLLVSGGNSLFPSFSKDGAWILFSSDRDGVTDTPWDLYQVPTAGGTIERITNTPALSEFGGCYNETRTMISYVGQAGSGDLSGVYVLSNTSVAQIATDWDANLGTYWTTSTGRSGRPRGARFQKLTLPKNLKKTRKTSHK